MGVILVWPGRETKAAPFIRTETIWVALFGGARYASMNVWAPGDGSLAVGALFVGRQVGLSCSPQREEEEEEE